MTASVHILLDSFSAILLPLKLHNLNLDRGL